MRISQAAHTFEEASGARTVAWQVDDRPLWFRVTGAGAADPGPASADPVAVGLLYPAMLLGADLEIDAPASPRLVFQLNNDVQALLRIHDPRLRRITVSARPGIPPRTEATGRTGTGFSAGVDSFAALAQYGGPDAPAGLRVTDLCVFDVGALGRSGRPEVEALFQRAARRTEAFAAAKGFGSFTVASNLDGFYAALGLSFITSHTLRNVAAALTLQGVFDTYLYSSSFGPRDLRAAPGFGISAMDPMMLPLLATERMTFLSAGAAFTRFEKTEAISGSGDAQRLLDVCVTPAAQRQRFDRLNCSRCWKCARTMASLDLLGKLDAFDGVFDVAHYRANRRALLDDLAIRALSGSKLDQEVVQLAKDAGLPLSPTAVVRAKAGAMQARRWLRFSDATAPLRRGARALRNRAGTS